MENFQFFLHLFERNHPTKYHVDNFKNHYEANE